MPRYRVKKIDRPPEPEFPADALWPGSVRRPYEPCSIPSCVDPAQYKVITGSGPLCQRHYRSLAQKIYDQWQQLRDRTRS